MTMMRRISGLTIAILILCTTAFTQDKPNPLSDYQYSKKDYPRYLDIKKETDAQKRCDLLLAFIKERAISKALVYAVGDYMECAKPYVDKKDWPKAIAMEEGLLALLPSEKAASDAIEGVEESVKKQQVDDYLKVHLVPSKSSVLKSLLAAYYQAKDLPKAADAAEKLYALAPDKAMFATLAAIYLEMKNYDKYLDYGKKILAEYPIDQSYQTAIQMGQVYIQKQDVNSALDLFSKTMTAFPDKTPPNVQEAQWKGIQAFVHLQNANVLYAKKDYPKAQELFEKVIKLDLQNDVAYYYVAMCKWKNNDSEGAIEPFAKCVALGKATAQKAQEYMEQIYKARHNNSLDGLDAVKAKAKADLGIK
jgi:tetratricopeptide (TPR) repeat protein